MAHRTTTPDPRPLPPRLAPHRPLLAPRTAIVPGSRWHAPALPPMTSLLRPAPTHCLPAFLPAPPPTTSPSNSSLELAPKRTKSHRANHHKENCKNPKQNHHPDGLYASAARLHKTMQEREVLKSPNDAPEAFLYRNRLPGTWWVPPGWLYSVTGDRGRRGRSESSPVAAVGPPGRRRVGSFTLAAPTATPAYFPTSIAV